MKNKLVLEQENRVKEEPQEESEIYTDLTKEEIERALVEGGDEKTLWNIYSTLDGNDAFDEEYNKVKYGINCEFDIRDVIEGFIEKKPEHGIVQIARKIKIDITLFRDEIDLRRYIMKEAIRSKYDGSFDKQGDTDYDTEE